MHINVSHINTGEVGDSAEFEIKGENPDISDIELTQPISGQVQMIKLDHGLQAKGQVHIVLGLECYRCLDRYEHQADLTLVGFFTEQPDDDQWPISARGEIDLAPMIRQEALLMVPIQQICREDCLGLCANCGQRQTSEHQHESENLVREPRITVKQASSGDKRRN